MTPTTAYDRLLLDDPLEVFETPLTRLQESGSYTISGNVMGYHGDGSGIEVAVHRQDTGQRVAVTRTTVGGHYVASVEDNTLVYYATAYQGAFNYGRSASAVPVAKSED